MIVYSTLSKPKARYCLVLNAGHTGIRANTQESMDDTAEHASPHYWWFPWDGTPSLPVARCIFHQLRNATLKKASEKRVDLGAASRFCWLPDGKISSKITGVDMSHLLLLLPFLLFDLLKDTVANHNDQHGTAHVSLTQDLIDWVLVLLESLSGIVCTGEKQYWIFKCVIIAYNR